MENENDVSSTKIHHGNAPRFYLKVNIQCCSSCPRRAKEKLQKCPGVLAVTIDTEAGLVVVTGTVDPQIIIQKFNKWGRNAVLCSPQKDPKGDSPDCSCCDDDSDSECDCTDRNYDHEKVHKTQNGPTGDQLPNFPNSNAHASTKKSKKLCGLLGLFSKKKEKAKPKPKDVGPKFPLGGPPIFRPNNMQAPFGNMFSLGMPAIPFGPLRPQFPPPFGSQYLGPTVYGNPAMLPFPNYYIHPRYPPFGFFQSRPPPPLYRPMIHYSRYEDNYF